MISTLKRAAKLCALLTVATFAAAAPGFAQAPSQAQRDAIKSQCRSDYIAHCSSIPPGGEASLQCLQQNMSSLSSGCKSAVQAVAAPAESGAEDGVRSGGCGHRDRGAQGRCERGCCRHGREKAEQRADFRDPQRLPFRLSKSLRGRTDRRRAGIAMPREEQGKAFGRLREGRRRSRQRWRCACGGRRACPSDSSRSGGGGRCGSARHRAAADAAARGTVCPEVGMRWRRPLALRRCGARRRPHHTMPGRAGGFDFTRMQGRPRSVFRAINRVWPAILPHRRGIAGYSPRKARISWISRTDSAM